MLKINFFFFIFIFLVQSRCYSETIDSSAVPKDTICSCKPSLPIEIAVTSIIYGVPSFWIWRVFFDYDRKGVSDARIIYMPVSLFLLMFSLGPIAEWTSGCEASYWNTLWIGLGSELIGWTIYAGYGFQRPQNIYKFNLPEYVALGIVPSVASVFIYNLFLHPKEKNDHIMYLIPSFGEKNTASLNFMMQF